MPIVDFDTSTWSDPWVQELPPLGKLLFNYTWTNDHKNVACVYPISLTTIRNETGLSLKQIEDTLSILYPKVQYDRDAQIIIVLNHVKRQFLKTGRISPKIVTAIRKNLLSLPEGHHFVALFIEKYKSLNLFTSEIPYPYPLEGVHMNPSSGGGDKDKSFIKKDAFKKPRLEDVSAYCKERGNSVDPQAWINHYTANGWRVGKVPMADWKAAVRTWEKTHNSNGNGKKPAEDGKPLDQAAERAAIMRRERELNGNE